MDKANVGGIRVARTYSLTTLAGLLLASLLVGCGGGGGSSPPPTTPPVTPPVTPPATPPATPPVADVPERTTTRTWIDDGRSIGSPYWGDRNTSDGGFGPPVDGLECTATTPNAYHVHSHLSIFLNGEALTVPHEVGFVALSPTEECHYPLHTHDESGRVHMHALAPTTFTLGQFFAIWGQPLGPDNVGGIVGEPAVIYLTDEDNVVTQYEGDFADIELLSHREITIQIGTPIDEIPNFMWSGP
jgi:hypothetical protein